MNDGTKKALLCAAAGLGGFLAVRATLRRMRHYDLRGKTVLLTGGSRGLGLVLARELVGRGARVALCARDPEELDHARADLVQRGGHVLTIPCDLREGDQILAMVREVLDRWAEIHVLINNAGIIQVGPVDLMTVAD